jgi:hypothetical protein
LFKDFEDVELIQDSEIDHLMRSGAIDIEQNKVVLKPSRKKRTASNTTATRARRDSSVAMGSSSHSTPLRPPRKKVAKARHKQTRLHDSEGEGDDLAQSEVLSEDSDDGESLHDFVVSTGAATSSAIQASTSSPLASSPPTRATKRNGKSFAFVIDSSDEDLSDGTEKAGKATPKSRASIDLSSGSVHEDSIDEDSEADVEDEEVSRRVQRQRMRRRLDDSEDDE